MVTSAVRDSLYLNGTPKSDKTYLKVESDHAAHHPFNHHRVQPCKTRMVPAWVEVSGPAKRSRP